LKKYLALILCLIICFLCSCTAQKQPISQIDDGVTMAPTSPLEVESMFDETLYNYFKNRPNECGAIMNTYPFSKGDLTDDIIVELAIATLRDDLNNSLERGEITQAEYEIRIKNFTTDEIANASNRCLETAAANYDTSMTNISADGDITADLKSYDTYYRMNTKSIVENADGTLTAEIDVQTVDEDSEWNNSAIEVLPDSECKHEYISIKFKYNEKRPYGMYLTYISVDKSTKGGN
jgi:hypothetical protein